MATKIQIARTEEPQLRPNAIQLEDGQPVINFNESEPGLYFKLRDDTLCKIGPTHVGPYPPNSSALGWPGNAIGEMWLDTSEAIAALHIWTGSEWTRDADVSIDTDQTITGQKTFTQAVIAEGGVTALDQDIFAESLVLSGTATSALTEFGMQDNVLTTKGYVDALASAPVLSTSLIAGDFLVGTSFNGSLDAQWSVDAATTGTNNVVARDGAGNFTANTITASLNGTATDCGRSVKAGVGLAGGGELDQDRTLAVFPDGDTISVSASGVKVNPNLSLTTATLSGELELTTAGDGVILASPNGTRYRLTVTDAGALDIAAV